MRFITNDLHFIWLGSSLDYARRERGLLKTWGQNPFYNTNYRLNLWYDPSCIDHEQNLAMQKFAADHHFTLQDVNQLKANCQDESSTDDHDEDRSLQRFIFQAYEQIRDSVPYKLWATCSDLLRLLIVYQYGGIYLDTDIWPAQTDDETLKDYLASTQNHENRTIENYISHDKRSTLPSQGVRVDNDLGILLCDYSQDFHHQCLESTDDSIYYSDVSNDLFVASPGSTFINYCMRRIQNLCHDKKCDSIVELINSLLTNRSFADNGAAKFKTALIQLGPDIFQRVVTRLPQIWAVPSSNCYHLNTVSSGSPSIGHSHQKQQDAMSMIKPVYSCRPFMSAFIMHYNNLSWLEGQISAQFYMPLRHFSSVECFKERLKTMLDNMSEHQKTLFAKDMDVFPPELINLVKLITNEKTQPLRNHVNRLLCQAVYQQHLYVESYNCITWLGDHIQNIYDSDLLEKDLDFGNLLSCCLLSFLTNYVNYFKAAKQVFDASTDPKVKSEIMHLTYRKLKESEVIPPEEKTYSLSDYAELVPFLAWRPEPYWQQTQIKIVVDTEEAPGADYKNFFMVMGYLFNSLHSQQSKAEIIQDIELALTEISKNLAFGDIQTVRALYDDLQDIAEYDFIQLPVHLQKPKTSFFWPFAGNRESQTNHDQCQNQLEQNLVTLQNKIQSLLGYAQKKLNQHESQLRIC